MSWAEILRGATREGVRLAVTSAGTLKVSGDAAAVSRWLVSIREHKPELVVLLAASDDDTRETTRKAVEDPSRPEDRRNWEAMVSWWLAFIGEPDPEPVIERCWQDYEARVFLKHACTERRRESC